MARFCTNCGNSIRDGAKFCGVCGQPYNEGAAGAQAPAQPDQGQWQQPQPADQGFGGNQWQQSQPANQSFGGSQWQQPQPADQGFGGNQWQQPQPADQSFGGNQWQQPQPADQSFGGNQWQQPQPMDQSSQWPSDNSSPFVGASGGSYQQGGGMQNPGVNNGQYGQGQYYGGYPQNNQTAVATAPKGKKNPLPLVIILGVVGVALIGVLLYFIFGQNDGDGPTKTVNNYIKYYVTADYDADKLLALMYEYNFCTDPSDKQDMYDHVADHVGTGDAYEDLKDEYGDDVKVEIEVLYSNELTGEDYRDAVDELSDTCSTDKIEKIFKVKVRESVKGSEDSDSFTEEAYVIKAGGKWYISDTLSG